MPGPELYPYQAEAVEAIATALSDGGSGQLHAACRTGKTLMALRAAERLVEADGLVIVLTPSLALVGQILGSWKKDSDIPFERYAVCSVADLGDRGHDEEGDEDEDTAARVADIAREHQVSTDPVKIGKWLVAEGPRLVVATYQSADRLAAAAREVGVEAGMLICDEAHHLAGRADSHTRQVMDDATLPARRRLYMTATPRIGSWRDDETRVLSMDDESAFGPALYRYTFARAISEGRLENYRIAAIGVTSREARDLLSRNDIEFTDGVTMRAAAAQIALARANRDFGMRRAFSFHHRVADAKEFVESLPRTFANLPDVERSAAPVGLHINGAMGHDERNRVMAQLKNPPENGWVIVSNVRCLSEGVDVPALDGVLFADPKQSTVDIVQSASRVLTKHPDAPGLSTIIVPVIVPDPGDDGEPGELDYGEFDGLVRVVRAMSEHDETLVAELNRRRSQIGKDPDGGDGDGVIICTGPDGDDDEDPDSDDTPDPIPGQPYEPIGDPPRLAKIQFCGIPPQFLAEMRLVVLRRATSEWWESFAHADAYYQRHGHLQVQGGDRFAGHPLGGWIREQRREFKAGRLALDRRDALDGIGMIWDVLDHAWAQNYELAVAFHAEHGHVSVPMSHVEGGRHLGSWINIQRGRCHQGAMPLEQKAALDRLGMSWRTSLPSLWALMYEAAAEYRDAHGDLVVPKNFVTATGQNLGNWISTQRVQFKRGALPEDRQQQLEDLGIEWDRFDARWASGMKAATAYWALHGNLRIPATHREGGFCLGAWLSAQRSHFETGTLSPDRQEALEALGIIWDLADERWTSAYAAAAAFYAEHGHLKVTGAEVYGGIHLGSWIGGQRKFFRKGSLSEERVRALDDIGMLWTPRDTQWERGFQAASDYRRNNGDLLVPGSYVIDGFRLGLWVLNKRQERRRGRLAPDRERLLDEIGMAWDARKDAGADANNPAASRAEREMR